jgi:hypothetical protein
MEDLLTPRTQRWHGLKVPAKYQEVAKNQAVKQYFEDVTNILFQMRYSPRANYASQKHQGYLSLGAFGNSCLFIDDEVGRGARYLQCHMSEIFWAEDQYGRIDTLYRRFPFEGRKALQRWGKHLSPKLKGDCEKDPFKTFEFIHCGAPELRAHLRPARYRRHALVELLRLGGRQGGASRRAATPPGPTRSAATWSRRASATAARPR